VIKPIETVIKPIETVYRGHRFRSRLEARWAVFFDAAGIEWRYEPDGYRINGRSYLPDFLLTKRNTFVEIKPTQEQARASEELMTGLVAATGKLGLVIGGAPSRYDEPVAYRFYHAPPDSYVAGSVINNRSQWRQCILCNEIHCGSSYQDEGCGCVPSVKILNMPYQSSSRLLNHAFDRAQGARFEHGEGGKPEPFRPRLVVEVRVYVAGSVIEDLSDNDDDKYYHPVVMQWRQDIFGESNHAIPGQTKDGRFIYAGPTITEDHGQATEGLADDCLEEVAKSDVVFVWIDNYDTLGTIAEVGAAKALEIPIFIAFADEKLSSHFYFVRQLSTVSVIAPTAVAGWRYFKNWQNR